MNYKFKNRFSLKDAFRRILTNWEAKYPEIIHKRLQRVFSDHFPIMLSGDVKVRVKRPFRFENMWLKEGFEEQVRNWWTSYSFQGSPLHPAMFLSKSSKL